MRLMGTATILVVASMAAAGAAAVYFSLMSAPQWVGWTQSLVLMLAMCLELLKVDLLVYPGRERGSVTVGVAGTFLVMALYGVEQAVFVALLQALVTAIINRSVWFKAVFNAGLFTGTTYLAGWIYVQLDGPAAAWGLPGVLASLTAAVVYFFTQSSLVSLAISLSSRRSFWRVWTESFSWMLLQQAATGMVGLLLGRFMQMGMTFIGALLLGSPLLLLRYSYKVYAERIQAQIDQIEQANTDLARLNEELKTTNNELIQTLGSVLDARDRYTFGHSNQVAMYAVAIGEKLSLPASQIEEIRQAALLHDIGKVGIPEDILYKETQLTDYEKQIMQAHAEIGYRIVSQIHSLSRVAQLIRQHHEWYGGGGYPLNLRGSEILLGARIISVADALDTIASDRPYRRGRPVEFAFSEIKRCTGTQFDPVVVQALESLMRERGGIWFDHPVGRFNRAALALEVAAAMAQGVSERK